MQDNLAVRLGAPVRRFVTRKRRDLAGCRAGSGAFAFAHDCSLLPCR
ncbi:hypothetical protein SAMN02745223_01141 [Devosia limi DSM 17137]|uniref:Uncharacterized protein n=1 Tax=Devosia limi DSM 17137 TaxID=1121477 RepID=A0A1M4WMH6_9HYPH|nr:hypothetical protein SAMN02745223_01141 [Devosia limi DSM 17137]